MHVTNVHKRTIKQPKNKVAALLKTLSTEHDKVWPKDNWSAMRFKNGLKLGAKGGHGIIRYSVEEYILGELIVFKFSKPIGFNGVHKFEVKAIDAKSTEVKHSIVMKTEGLATLKWIFVIRWLHDALIENAFDTIENNFSEAQKFTRWSVWVRIWRYILTR